MQLSTLLTPERTLCGATGRSKKRVLETIIQFICEDISSLDEHELFEKIIERERLGSTGLGNGIAIPHCRINNCSRIIGCLVKLDEPIDFDAIDGKPVDLLFVLIVPNEASDEHLEALSTIAKLFNDETFCQTLRSAKSNEELFNLATKA